MTYKPDVNPDGQAWYKGKMRYRKEIAEMEAADTPEKFAMRVPMESTSFHDAMAMLQETGGPLLETVRSWAGSTVVTDDAMFVVFVSDDFTPDRQVLCGDRPMRTADGVEVVLDGWPEEADPVRITTAKFREIWALVCGGERGDVPAEDAAPPPEDPVAAVPEEVPTAAAEAHTDAQVPAREVHEMPASAAEAWSLVPRDEVLAMDTKKLSALIVRLQDQFSVKTPRGFDLMSEEAIREWVAEACSSEPVRRLAGRQDVMRAIRRECGFRKCTDLGNAERLIDMYGDIIRYRWTRKGGFWYIWHETHWEEDETDEISRLANEVARSIYLEAYEISDDNIRAAVGKWAKSTESQGKRVAMVASAGPLAAIRYDDLDADGDLMNFANGTLRMSTGEFREHRKTDMITKIVPHDFDPDAECPLWTEHLSMVFGGDTGFIRDFQMIMGYMMLDGNPEQILVILHGSGQNGKSVTTNIIKAVLGDYAAIAAPESFASRRGANPAGARSDLVDIMESRLVVVGEGEEGRILDESMVKLLTGGDPVKLRKMYETDREFDPRFTVMMHSNHRPRIRETTHAIWRRIWLIPFEQRIPDEKKDSRITEKLLREAPGIMNWLLAGLRRYFENGCRLPQPDRIKNAVEEYRAQEDPLASFLEDVCELGETYEVTRAALSDDYHIWCKANGEKPMSARKFSTLLRERGIKEGKIVHGTRWWQGIRLKSQCRIDQGSGVQGADGCTSQQRVSEWR